MVNRHLSHALHAYCLPVFLIAATLPHLLSAQQPDLPPVEPAQPLPQEQAAAQLRVTTNVVLVPTLVEKDHGNIIYGLKTGDFALEDNGVPQKLRVEEDMDSAPIALVVAVQQGRMSGLEYDKVFKLG